MTDSRNFDPIAPIYDATRITPEPVAAYGFPAILDAAGPGARILEAGTGTGRVAMPLLALGADVIGVDISMAMMARQRAKSDRARLACASATALPFAAGRFDAVLTVHVLHLIADWRGALTEFRRVLRPGGVYINARGETIGDSPQRRATGYWREWVAARGGLPAAVHIGADDPATINAALAVLGATVTTVDVVRYTTRYTLGERVERLRARTWSSAYDVPDDLLAASADALATWVTEEYGSLDTELEDEEVFRLHVARFV